MLQSFNVEQEKQNQKAQQRLKEFKEDNYKLSMEIEQKCNLFKAYASFDEISEKVARVQQQMHGQQALFDSLSH